jgi:hypothetical protein
LPPSVSRARPDGGGDGKNALTAVLFGESRRHMGNALLVAALHHLQMAGILLQRLADTQHVAVPKDGGRRPPRRAFLVHPR